METHPSKRQKVDVSPTELLEKIVEISKKLELSKNSNFNNYMLEESEIVKGLLRIIYMEPLFASQLRFEKICRDYENMFVLRCLKSYYFQIKLNDSINKIYEKKSDLKYIINFCGTHLTCLDVSQYPDSSILPIINANCPNLENLVIGIKEIMNQDFENVFSNMSYLRDLRIEWQCKNSILPVTLAESLKQIGGTLEILNLECCSRLNNFFSPDSLALVFPRLIALKALRMEGFVLSQPLVHSMSGIINLTNMSIRSYSFGFHPKFDAAICMYPIGYLKNLQLLTLESDHGITDQCLINICKNAKKLSLLSIDSNHITDDGIRAINNLEQLETLWLNSENQFITDESIQSLFNPELVHMTLSRCNRITDASLFKLYENLPKLYTLEIFKTKITRKAVKKIYELAKSRSKKIIISHT